MSNDTRTRATPPVEMVERVARAIYGVPRTDPNDAPHAWEHATEGWRKFSLRQAAAALAAASLPDERVRVAKEALLNGTLSMTKRQVIIDFDSRERAEEMFEALVSLRARADGAGE